MDPERFMRRAIELSRRNLAENSGGPFGAVIVKDGDIVGEGRNMVVSATDPTAHAEIVAIRDACQRLGTFSLEGCEIFASCEPCPMCLAAILWARLDRITYASSLADAVAASFDDNDISRDVCLPPDERSIPSGRLLASEAHRVFEEWAAKPDKVPY
jgi:guanine deaminase